MWWWDPFMVAAEASLGVLNSKTPLSSFSHSSGRPSAEKSVVSFLNKRNTAMSTKMYHNHDVAEWFCCKLLCKENFPWAPRKDHFYNGVGHFFVWQPLVGYSCPSVPSSATWGGHGLGKKRIMSRMPWNFWLHLGSWATRASVGRESSCSLGCWLR